MKATATKDFSASMSGRDFKCECGDVVEADARTVEQLEAAGLVRRCDKPKRAAKARKAVNDD